MHCVMKRMENCRIPKRMHETRMNDKRGEERTEIRSKRRDVEGADASWG